jgi:rhomboid protease GluP
MRLSRSYPEKLKHVLPAFSLVLWGSVILLGLFRWIFFIGKYPVLELDEDILNYWIPVTVSWIPILLWLKPRFKPFVFKTDNVKGSWRLQLIAWISISAALIFSQYYLTTSTGKLLELKNVKEISKHERVRYYRIKEFAVYPYIGGIQYAFRVTGRYSENLDIDIYFVNPILTHKTQHIVTAPLYWYGVTFNKRISNWGNNANKEKRFRAFLEKCIADMRHYDFHKLDHFEHKPASYDRENFRKAVQIALRKPVNTDFVILQPVKDAYESRNGYKTAWIFASYATGIIIYMLVLISPSLKKEPEETSDEGPVIDASDMG